MTEDPRRLLLLRHAKAEPAGSARDALRPLAPQGRDQAGRVGRALLAAGLLPDLVLVSSALRTRQTWEGLAMAWPDPPLRVEVLDDLYHASAEDVIAVVGTADQARTVLVVGHEPTMSHTAAVLAWPGSQPAAVAQVRTGVPTATWSLLEVRAAWDSLAPSAMTLTAVVRPD